MISGRTLFPLMCMIVTEKVVESGGNVNAKLPERTTAYLTNSQCLIEFSNDL